MTKIPTSRLENIAQRQNRPMFLSQRVHQKFGSTKRRALLMKKVTVRMIIQ